MIHNKEDAKEAYTELWAFMKLCSIYMEGLLSDKYPNDRMGAEFLMEEWREKVESLSKDMAEWLRRDG